MTKYRNCTTKELLIKDALMDYYDPELVLEVCRRADLLVEFEAADGENFEKILDRAFEILGL